MGCLKTVGFHVGAALARLTPWLTAAAVAEFHNGGEENECNGRMPEETTGFIKNGVSRLEIVNNRVLKNVGSTQVCK